MDIGHGQDFQTGAELVASLRRWAGELGFAGLTVAGVDLGLAGERLNAWLAAGRHGGMYYMASHGDKRAKPAELVAGTRTVLVARFAYPVDLPAAASVLAAGDRAYVSRYALGRDYHKVVRSRLAALARRLEEAAPAATRVFCDSGPVMEVALAAQSGLGWQGKNTLLLDRSGSFHFLGEIYTDLELPADPPVAGHCGSCRRCLDDCPTGAFVAPGVLDARRCISYLTIEHAGPIPEDMRRPLGNRIYGCDDCQLVCPWNRFTGEEGFAEFAPRHGLEAPALVDLAAWSEADFLSRTEGMAMRRMGYSRWRRNLAVALGNGPDGGVPRAALEAMAAGDSDLVREHARWGLAELRRRRSA